MKKIKDKKEFVFNIALLTIYSNLHTCNVPAFLKFKDKLELIYLNEYARYEQITAWKKVLGTRSKIFELKQLRAKKVRSTKFMSYIYIKMETPDDKKQPNV